MKKAGIAALLILTLTLSGCGFMPPVMGGGYTGGGFGGGGGYTGGGYGGGSSGGGGASPYGFYGGEDGYGEAPSQEEPYEPSIEELLAQSGNGGNAPQAPAAEEPATADPVQEAPAAEAPATADPALNDRPNATTGYGTPKFLSNGDVAPDFTVQTADGGTFTLSDYDGGVVVINFWATWCDTCVDGMPVFEQLKADGKAAIIGINCGEDRQIVNSYIAQSGYTYTIGYDDDYRVQDYYPTNGIPYTLVIKNGIIHEIFEGAYSADRMYQEYCRSIGECL